METLPCNSPSFLVFSAANIGFACHHKLQRFATRFLVKEFHGFNEFGNDFSGSLD